MNVLKLDESSHHVVLLQAEQIIRNGGIAVVPTDTVYGFVGNAADETVVEKLYSLKRRPEEKPFPIFVKDIAAARRHAYIADTKASFLEKIWPGPATVIFDDKGKLPARLTAGRSTLGIRIPDHRFLRGLLEKLPFPLVQTSVNISGASPARTVEEIMGYFPDGSLQPDFVVDAGLLEAVPSTVIDFTGHGPIIMRSGIMTKRELDMLLYPAAETG